jgi:hypothetical protein
MRKLIIGSFIAIALVFSFACGNAFAQSSKVSVISNGLSIIPASSTENTTSSEDASNFQTIMTTYIKTPKDKGICFDVAIQSGIVTYTQVKSKGKTDENLDTSMANGRIKIRVKISDEDGNFLGYASPSEDGHGDGVTFSYRMQEMSAQFQGNLLNCIQEDGTIDLGDGTCLDYEMVSLLLSTLEANAFNFYYGDTVAGVYKIEVEASCETAAEFQNGNAHADAFVGLGSMCVDTVRLVKGSDGKTIIDIN